jgi:YYY domain-containing protein
MPALQTAVLGVLIAAAVSMVVFRVAMPYAFADSQIVRETAWQQTGQEPGPISVAIRSVVGINPQWWNNMEQIQAQQTPEAFFPPALQWTARAPIIFPLTNMILYGMGLTAGLLAWLAFLWAVGRISQARPDWLAHALPVFWIGTYFLFMGTRWVKSIRYFLPLYPFLFLLAGWALVYLWQRSEVKWQKAAVGLLAAVVILPSLLWANAFTEIYRQPVTRVTASAWMFDNIPSGATLLYETAADPSRVAGPQEYQLPLRGFDFFAEGMPLYLHFRLPEDGTVTAVRLNYLRNPLGQAANSTLRVTLNPDSALPASAEYSFALDNERRAVTIPLPPTRAAAAGQNLLLVEHIGGAAVEAGTSIIANEHWDDPLPVRYDGRDPYSGYYQGVREGQIPITNIDNFEKREGFERWLAEADVIALSSQRALWHVPRLPLTYPMTTRYFEALFNGELGFDLVAEFHADLHIGPLYISDTGGKLGWGAPPTIGWPPPGEHAAEEAFSVYDHPPVWIFRKTERYDPTVVSQILGEIDLNQVVFTNPGQATQARNGLVLSSEEVARQQAGGTFRELFNPDGVLSQNPWLAAVVWWLAVVALGWIAFPIAYIALRGLPDRGLSLSRILALLLISYFGWLMGSLKWLPFTRPTLLLGLALMALASALILWRRWPEIRAFLRENGQLVGFSELFSLGLYLLFILVRLGNPDVWDVIWGGEKPMDLAYFTAVMKSTTFPPYDPWFAGGYINYYYYGFVYVGGLTLLLGIVPAVAYNLILPMLYSFVGLGVFGLTYNLVLTADRRRQTADDAPQTTGGRRSAVGGQLSAVGSQRSAVIAGVFAAMLAVLLGNLAQVRLIMDVWLRAGSSGVNTGLTAVDNLAQFLSGGYNLLIRGQNAPIYPGDWFWSATRAIAHAPGEAGPITEFPFFTFLYGDLHAHMIALPLTLLALGWAFSLVMGHGLTRINTDSLLAWLVGVLAIGSLRPTNTWDWPTYLFIGALAIAYSVYRRHGRFGLQMAGQAGLHIVALVALTTLAFLPFSQNYGAGYTSLQLWQGSKTPVGDYLLIHGLFLFLAVTHLLRELRAWGSEWTTDGLARWQPVIWPLVGALALFPLVMFVMWLRGYLIAPIALPIIVLAGILGLRPNLPVARRIVLILISSAVGLTLFVEMFVLEGDISRMNTVFKFYMQVWILLSVAGGAAFIWSWQAAVSDWGAGRRNIWQGALALLLIASLLYPILATRAKWQIRMNREAPITLDGMAFMPTTHYFDTDYLGQGQRVDLVYDYEAIQWMQRNISGSPVIAEAHSGNPYRSVGNRISMYTGLPAIVGWDWHQRQQRAVLPGNQVGDRIRDVIFLYNSYTPEEALPILAKYNVRYIYVGQLEWTYYNPQGLLKFDEMVRLGYLEEVYRNAGTSIYRVNE